MSCTGSMSDMDIPKKPPHKSASEHRRATKPIMEKRRRARINNSLNELKSLILDALNKDPSRHSKLEKADILEMTVRHLQNLQRQQMAMEMARDPSVLNKFRAGFTECATEVSRYVNKIDGVDGGAKQRLLSHLHGCVSSISTVAASANQAAAAAMANGAFPGMTTTTGRDGQPQLQVHIPGLPAGMTTSLFPSSVDGAMNLSSSASDLNNNSTTSSGRRSSSSGLPETSKLSTPPPSGSSQFSFQFPPTGVQSSLNSPATPTTPSTPGRHLSIAVSPSAFPGPSSVSSGYNSFSFPSPSHHNQRFQPYRRERDLGSVSPCSRSSLGSMSPSGSDMSNCGDLDVVEHEIVKRENDESGDVWRPW